MAGGLNTYGYVGGNPVGAIDPLGLDCVSRNGITSCSTPNGPTFKVPTPVGYPQEMRPGDKYYHIYDVMRAINGANPDCVFQGLVDNPTPGNPAPATPEGTTNNGEVAGIDNIVKSYLTYDVNTGAPLVVNIAGTDDGSLFGPGYVVR